MMAQKPEYVDRAGRRVSCLPADPAKRFWAVCFDCRCPGHVMTAASEEFLNVLRADHEAWMHSPQRAVQKDS